LFLRLGSHYYREPPAPAGGGSTATFLPFSLNFSHIPERLFVVERFKIFFHRRIIFCSLDSLDIQNRVSYTFFHKKEVLIKFDEFLDRKLSPTRQPTVLRLPA
jgi:hypothetical protein